MPKRVPDQPADPLGWQREVRRLPELAVVDRSEVEATLDAGIVAHVGFSAEGHPYVLPMAYARIGADLFLHGSVASRLVRALCSGTQVCVTVTVLDGIVLARSAFNTSMNYRSVMVMGETEEVTDPAARSRVFEALLERLVPGRYPQLRAPRPDELRRTLVARLPVEIWSAKVSTGPPDDGDEDVAFPVWAGEIPLRLVAGAPVAAPGLAHDLLAGAPDLRRPRPRWAGP